MTRLLYVPTNRETPQRFGGTGSPEFGYFLFGAFASGKGVMLSTIFVPSFDVVQT